MNSITPTKLEPANYANLNAKPAPLHPVSALTAMPARTEWLELTPMDNKLVSANQDITQLLMVHAFNPTATLILSAPNANKDFNNACNALPPNTE